MYTDLPVLRRCCFCFPLRPGLIAWVYIKMVTNMLFLGFLSYHLHYVISLWFYMENSVFLLCLMITYILLDSAFGVIFLVGAHKKSFKLMKIYYKYCVGMLILHLLSVLVLLFYIAVVISNVSKGFLFEFVLSDVGSVLFLLFEMTLLVYMIILVNSEVLKLESSLEGRLERSSVARDNAETPQETYTAFNNRLANEPELIIVQH